MSFDVNQHRDVLEFKSAIDDRIESERERDGEPLYRQILGSRKRTRIPYGTEKFRPRNFTRGDIAKGQALCSPPTMKQRDLANVSWDMLEYKCGSRICCDERPVMELIYSDPVDVFMDEIHEDIDNAGDNAFITLMNDTTNNSVVNFQSFAGNTLAVSDPASALDEVMLNLRKQFMAKPAYVVISLDVLIELQLHPNIKETQSMFLGSAAIPADRVRTHIGQLFGVAPGQVFVDDTVVNLGPGNNDDTQQNYLSTNFIYFGTDDHIRLYEGDCSQMTTTKVEHDTLEWVYKEVWDLQITADPLAGVLVNNLL